MNYDENINLQSNLFSVFIHLSILFVMIFTVQWSPQYPYFGEVELWEAVPTIKEQAQTPAKPKNIEVKKSEKSAPVESQKIKDEQAAINLKKKKEKELAEKKKQEQIKKLQQELLKQEQIKQLQDQLLQQEQLEKLQKELLEQDTQNAEQEIISEDKKKSERIAIQADQDMEAGKNKSEIDKYKALIQQKIQQNVNNNLCGLDYLSLSFEITLLPSGELLNDPVLKDSSGNLSCDEAVERAIYQSEPLPVPTDPKIFAKLKKIKLKFYPNGQPQ